MSEFAFAEGVPRTRPKDWSRVAGLLWRASPGSMVGLAVATAAVAAIPAAQLGVIAAAVQAVADGISTGLLTEARNEVLRWGGILLALMAASHLLGVLTQYLNNVMLLRLATSVGERLMRTGTQLEMSDFENSEAYDALQRAYQESTGGRLHQLFSDLLDVAREVVTVVSVGAVIVSWNPWLGLLILLAPLPSAAAQLWYGRKIFEIEYVRAPQRRRLMYYQFLTTTDHSFKEVRLFGLADYLVERYREVVQRFLAIDRGIARRQALAFATLGLISVMATVAAVYLTMSATLDTGNIGRLAGFLTALTTMQASMHGILMTVGSLYESSLFVGNLFRVFDMPRPRPQTVGRPFPEKIRLGFEFRNVRFRYPGTTRWVLDDFNLTLPPNEMVAIVGENGSGKTTVVKLLSRLYEPTEGSILLDGVPLDEYDPEDYRQNIGVIFQDFIKYEMPVRHNVGFGRVAKVADDHAIDDALRKGGGHEIVERLPEGMDTMLGRHFSAGHQLSGGQWQRVALARAFIRDAPVVILDEPTASIDAAAEQEIFERFRQITGDKISLLIAHRFSTVRMADQILVIDAGRPMESGTHAELMALDGRYAHLFALQARGYADHPGANTAQVNGVSQAQAR